MSIWTVIKMTPVAMRAAVGNHINWQVNNSKRQDCWFVTLDFKDLSIEVSDWLDTSKDSHPKTVKELVKTISKTKGQIWDYQEEDVNGKDRIALKTDSLDELENYFKKEFNNYKAKAMPSINKEIDKKINSNNEKIKKLEKDNEELNNKKSSLEKLDFSELTIRLQNINFSRVNVDLVDLENGKSTTVDYFLEKKIDMYKDKPKMAKDLKVGDIYTCNNGRKVKVEKVTITNFSDNCNIKEYAEKKGIDKDEFWKFVEFCHDHYQWYRNPTTTKNSFDTWEKCYKSFKRSN